MEDIPSIVCRVCGESVTETFVDLGSAPPCEAFLPAGHSQDAETHYPLHVRVCHECLLVQLPECLPAEEIFTDAYPYFSSFSDSWVEHARRYTEAMTGRLHLDDRSLVMEVASNDGYLLQHFRGADIPVLGIEPTANTAAAARERGIATEVLFLGELSARDLVDRHGRADLVVANNVYAHVPDLRDFTLGLATLLAEDGTLTIEVQHLARLIEHGQYDTIYHEHFQYYTLLTLQRALALGGLVVLDVEELPTHGGSLRVHVQHRRHATAVGREPGPEVDRVLALEAGRGLHTLAGHRGFSETVSRVKDELLTFLLTARREGRRVVGYGAPGKGNTLLNHCGIRSDLVDFTVDRNPHKHGTYLPGSRIPVRPVDALAEARPDYVLVLPWNLRTELTAQLQHVGDWGGRLVFAIPKLDVVEPTKGA